LDTCHCHDAGFNVKSDFDNVMHEFDNLIGLDKLFVVHLNDSKNPIGSHKDRHENIGFGEIGFAAIHYIASHPLLAEIPKILETPYIKSSSYSGRSYPPYKQEIEMILTNTFNQNLSDHVINEYEGESS